MHTFKTTSPPRITIDFRSGSINIDTQDVEETTVELRGHNDDSATRSLIDDTVIDQRSGDIVVLVPKRTLGLFGRTPDLLLDITAPHGSRLNVKSDSADLSARGSYGQTRAASGSGDLSIEQLTGSAQLRSGSGDVTVNTVEAALTVGTGSGDIQVDSAHADLTVQSGSGSVVVDSVIGSLKAQTGSGDVAVRRVSRGRVNAKAASGDLHVGVADGVPAWLDVKTVTGGVSNELESSDPVGAGEQYVRLDLKTVSGDIDIVRA
jgi:hypothetical protein